VDNSKIPQSIRGVLVLSRIIDFKDYMVTTISASSATGFVILIVSIIYPPEYMFFILPACIMLLGASILLSNEYVDIMIESKSISNAKEGEYVNASGEVVESRNVRQAPFTNDDGCIIAWQVEEEFDNSQLSKHGSQPL
jgi:hypothetical protein